MQPADLETSLLVIYKLTLCWRIFQIMAALGLASHLLIKPSVAKLVQTLDLQTQHCYRVSVPAQLLINSNFCNFQREKTCLYRLEITCPQYIVYIFSNAGFQPLKVFSPMDCLIYLTPVKTYLSVKNLQKGFRNFQKLKFRSLRIFFENSFHVKKK